MTEKLSVLLCTEGTYPYLGGGVSTWCDILCKGLSEVDYYIYAITGHPNVALRYELPPNVKKVIHIPLWGSRRASGVRSGRGSFFGDLPPQAAYHL